MLEHQIIGTTIYVGKTHLSTIYGQVTSYTFQDLIHKGYIIALSHGNIQNKTLYTRLHSSCVTSQLMRSLDCDCVQQLNGAIKKICQGDGILFYLIQEGRGCGYVGKSRACMNVQYHEENRNINTFQAYQMLGMKHDYRDYSSVRDILNILHIDPEFILLTNNPDKIQKFTKLNLNLKSVQSIEVAPNPFNQTYLHSKQIYGHILYQAKKKVQKYVIPYERIQPFTPYSIQNCQRFVYVSSYYLPIKPINNYILLSPQQYHNIYPTRNKPYQIVRDPARKNEFSYYLQVQQHQLQQHKQLSRPNWFQINVHYDLVTNQDYLVLKYGDCKDKNKTPIIRIHSESLFNRFPLVDRQYTERYKKSLDLIIRNGCGLILIFYNDGRGSGLGYYVMNKDQEVTNKQLIGVQSDKRDYYGAIRLLKNYIDPNSPIDLLSGNTSRQTLQKQFKKHNIQVNRFIRLSSTFQKKGIMSIQHRIRSLKNNALQTIRNVSADKLHKLSELISQKVSQNIDVYSTGIGSSQAHSKYLQVLFDRKIKHINSIDIDSLQDKNCILIVFSQGLSPNIIYCLNKMNPKNIILITSMTLQRATGGKLQYLTKINNQSFFLTYPQQTPDDTLIRVTGPFISYCICSLFKNCYKKSLQQIKSIISTQSQQLQKLFNKNYQVCGKFTQNLSKLKNLIICCDSPAINLIDNVRYKLIQGSMINTHKVDYISLAHGTFQFIQSKKDFCVWFITNKFNPLHQTAVKMLNLPSQNVHVSYYRATQLPLELELEANNIVFQLIQILQIDQITWPGKDRQNMLYNVYKQK